MFPILLRTGLVLAVFLAAFALKYQNTQEVAKESVQPQAAAQSAHLPRSSTVAVQSIIDQTNRFRKENELEDLVINPQLTKTAEYFAKFMAETDQYGHQADDATVAERAKKHSYDYCLVLENIAYQYSSAGFEQQELADRFFKGWKTSEGHRKNMLDADVVETGVAVAQSPKTGYYYAVQLFGRPKSMVLRFLVENKTPEEIAYQIGERKLTLPSRFTRTHEECRRSELTLTSGDKQMGPIVPKHGETLIVSRTRSGENQLNRSSSDSK